MADVVLTTSDSAKNLRRARHSFAWHPTDELLGYHFSLDDGADLVYRKTVDGGVTWGSSVEIEGDATISFCIWPDWWMPTDVGLSMLTKIHIVWIENTNHDVMYRSLDTNTDTLGTAVLVENEASATSVDANQCSIVRAVGGNLYISWNVDDGTEIGFERSEDGGASWKARTIGLEATSPNDRLSLLPAINTGDIQDVLAVYTDASALAITVKWYDNSANTWTESSTLASFVSNVLQNTCGAWRWSDGHLIISVTTDADTGTADHRMFDVDHNGTAFSITELTAITTDIDDHYYASVFIDQLTDDIYVVYNGKRDGSESLGVTSKIYYTKSTDGGTTWSSGDTTYMEGSAGELTFVHVPMMGAKFIAIWQTGNNTLSTNVTNSVTLTPLIPSRWTIQNSAADNSWLAIAWSPSLSLYAAVALDGSANRVMTSPDGVTWTSRTSPSSGGEALWLDVIWVPGSVNLFVAVAGTAYVATIPRIMTSPDGITWTTRTAPVFHDWRSLAYSPSLGLIVAVGGDSGQGTTNMCMTSTDAITWTIRLTPTPVKFWIGLTWSPDLNLFVAVAFSGTGNRIMTCPNPSTTAWTYRTTPADIGWRSICWAGGAIDLLVAVASTGTGASRVMTSPDGTTWTMRTAAGANDWFSVEYSPELDQVFACAHSGTNDRIMYSEDGTGWTFDQTPSGNYNSWRDLEWSPEQGKFVAVGASGTGNRVMTSMALIPFTKSLTVSIATAVSIVKQMSKAMVIGIASVASITKLAGFLKSMAVGIASTATITGLGRFLKSMAVGIASTATITQIRALFNSMAVGIASEVSLVKEVFNLLTNVDMAAQISTSATLSRVIGMVRSVSIPVTASISTLAAFARSLVVEIPVTAAIVRTIALVRSVSVDVVATMTKLTTRVLSLLAEVSVTATLSRVIGMIRSVSIPVTASISTLVAFARSLVVEIPVAAAITRTVVLVRSLSVEILVAASMSGLQAKVLAASIGVTAVISMTRALTQSLVAQITSVASIFKGTMRSLIVEIQTTARISTDEPLSVYLAASISVAATIAMDLFRGTIRVFRLAARATDWVLTRAKSIIINDPARGTTWTLSARRTTIPQPPRSKGFDETI